MVFVGIVTGVFLPVRLTFWTYVSHAWHTNLGMMTVIALTMFCLVRSGKLGWFGKLFHREMARITSNKMIKKLLIASLFDIIPILFFLQIIDIGEDRKEELELILALSNPYSPAVMSIKSGDSEHIISIPMKTMIVAQTIQPDLSNKILMEHIQERTFPLPLMGYILNKMNLDMTRGWGSHFASVYLIEQLEGIGLYFFYRYVYQIEPKGTAWKKLGLYDNKIKLYIRAKPKKIHK